MKYEMHEAGMNLRVDHCFEKYGVDVTSKKLYYTWLEQIKRT